MSAGSARHVGVTGAAGKTGRAVVDAVLSRGHDVTALVRRPEQRGDLEAAGARAVVVELLDEDGLTAALAGLAAVYHVPPNLHPEEPRIAATLLAASRRAGVGRFVLHSVLAPYLPEMPHHLRKAESERLLRLGGPGGASWTVLQPASYAQNVLPYLADARTTGVLAVPYDPAARFSPVDLGDVAEVGARVLTEDGHDRATYELCGPEVLDTAAMAEALARVLGRPVRAEPVPLERWRSGAAALPEQVREDLAAMFAHYDAHGLAGSGRVLGWLLGRAPTSFEAAVARDSARDGYPAARPR